MKRAIRSLACLSLMLAAACGPKPRPTTIHDLQTNDAAVCYKNASIGNLNLHGEGSMYMYVDADGAISAAWFHDAGTLDSPTLFNCLIGFAVESKRAAAPVDSVYRVGISCQENGCGFHSLEGADTAAFDEGVAQRTLAFADWADATDKGWGYYYTHKYSDAQATFSSVLDVNPNDTRALRGLAQTLTDSNGDMKKAREAADKAVSLAPKSAATLEALIRVCVKLNDDDCVLRNFQDAAKAADVNDRSLELQDLLPLAKAAGARLEAAEKQHEEEQAKAQAAAQAAAEAKADPLGCGKLKGEEQAKCFVKGCFAAGAETYAAELSKLSKRKYSAGDLTSAAGAAGQTTVTIPIRTATARHAKPDTSQDATWSISMDSGVMKAGSPAAAQIAKDHNACK